MSELKLRFRKIAREEFDNAADWYEDRKVGQGVDFTDAVQHVLNDVALRPEYHPRVYEDIREAMVSRYP